MTPMSRIHRMLLAMSRTTYRLLVLRYPADLRERYGKEMSSVFEAQAREALERTGIPGLAKVWAKTIRDLMRPLPGPIGAGPGSRDAVEPDADAKGLAAARPARSTIGRRRLAGAGEDLRFAVRSLVREPRFTVLVVGVLGVGIALNTSAFAVLNAYLLRPLPFPASDRLVSVRNAQALSWTEVDHVFEQAVSWDLDVFTIVGSGRPELAPGAWVTPGFLETYGIRPAVGRAFRPDEAGRDGAPVAMISHRLWQDHFGGDPDIVGRSFSAFTSDRPDHAELFTIVGVLPADFWYLNEYTDVLAPIRVDRTVYSGRLHGDVPRERAEAMLTELATARMDDVPPGFRVELTALKEQHVASVRPTLVVLQAAVLLVLLIASANAAVLLLVRSTRREHELGVRRALGASGGRLARQLLLEGGLVAGAATALGVGLSVWLLGVGGPAVEARLGLSVPGGSDALRVDGTVLLGAMALAGVVGLVFGIVPLVTALRRTSGGSMADVRGGSGESPGRRRFRSAMVAAEVALSLALLTGAGLMVRSAVHLQSQDLGFDPTNIVRGLMGLRDATYPDPEDRVAAFDRLRESLASVPEVEGVGLASMGLFTTRFGPRSIEGLADGVVSRAEAVRWIVDEGYFDVLDVPVRRGRTFTETDVRDGEEVAVISESLARDLWGDADPVGRDVRVVPFSDPGMAPPEPGPWRRVVGVVGDVEREVGGDPAGDIYLSFRQADRSWLSAYVRFEGDPGDAEPRLQAAVDAVSSEIPFASVRRLDVIVDEAMQPTRYVAWLLAGFSAFALLLAVVGLYGVISYAARQRRKDVAIRVALGADRGRVTSLFVRQGAAMVAVGVLLGTVGGLALGRALESQLHGVRPGDPATHALIAGALAVSALVAVWIPARRAAASEPMRVLREE